MEAEHVQRIDLILNKIRENALELNSKNYSAQVLLTNAFSRGKKLLTNNITEQDIVDISAIAIALILKR